MWSSSNYGSGRFNNETDGKKIIRVTRGKSEQAGITLIGYLRARGTEIYSHPQQMDLEDNSARIAGITGVILTGGRSANGKR